MYLISRLSDDSVLAYAYYVDYSVSERVNWAAGSLMPNPVVAIGAALWVDAGEDNDVYNQLLQTGADTTDYEAVKRMLQEPEKDATASWFNHGLSIYRESLDSQTDRYWVVYHNTMA